jgi:hypothetical protein
MKQLIEKAAETPDISQREPARAVASSKTKASGTVVTSLRRLGFILLGWDSQYY